MNKKIALELSYFGFVIVCFIVGFSPWLYWLKYHSTHDQSLMVVLDVVFVFILMPINGFIIIVKAILSLLNFL